MPKVLSIASWKLEIYLLCLQPHDQEKEHNHVIHHYLHDLHQTDNFRSVKKKKVVIKHQNKKLKYMYCKCIHHKNEITYPVHRIDTKVAQR
jgi:hypothetical protein